MAAKLTPVQVLDILASRLKKTANCCYAVNISKRVAVAIAELRRYAKMIRAARDYLSEQGFG